MSIPVERENAEELKRWGLGLEKLLESCVFCRAGTPFWHRATKQPVCQYCASTHDIAELPATLGRTSKARIEGGPLPETARNGRQNVIRHKLPQPTPEQIRAARKAVGLSQTAAIQLVSDAGAKGYRTWQRFEAPMGSHDHREIPNGTWELFLLLTDQHPTHRMVSKTAADAEKSE